MTASFSCKYINVNHRDDTRGRGSKNGHLIQERHQYFKYFLSIHFTFLNQVGIRKLFPYFWNQMEKKKEYRAEPS